MFWVFPSENIDSYLHISQAGRQGLGKAPGTWRHKAQTNTTIFFKSISYKVAQHSITRQKWETAIRLRETSSLASRDITSNLLKLLKHPKHRLEDCQDSCTAYTNEDSICLEAYTSIILKQ